ncbi:MAG: c-type cytochrome [Planctomycetota bacterium]|jgi:mono/diheme cytochrome c family protein
MPIPTASRPAVTLLLAVLACAGTAAAQDADAPAPDAPAPDAFAPDAHVRETFLRACATCHGEDGSGTGPTVLDRPARDFKSGGFSFGNTPDALLRTITYGIPGTPMPAFGEAYPDEERMRLAEYVRSLGPPVEELDVSDRVVVVTDRPRVVRGILPPVTDTAPLRPRGLLIGTPEGLSFEYRIDDVRLLAVRQGDFVERTDWIGRGGTPLLPLGVPVVIHEGGDPGPAFERLVNEAASPAFGFSPSLPLHARLREVRESGSSIALGQSLSRDGRHAADVTETVRAVTGPTGVAYERTVQIHDVHAAWTLTLPLAPVGPTAPPTAVTRREQVLSTLPDGRVACLQVGVTASDPSADPVVWQVQRGRGAARLAVELRPGLAVRLVVRTILLPEWTDETRAALAAWEPVR